MRSLCNIGVMFRREQPPERLPAYAARAEAIGFDEFWVVEDCFYAGGIAQAATALASTDRITVGLGIAPAVVRNAAFLALEFAALARMFPGRFHGGIGHGVGAWMEQVGAKPESWLGALEETTTAVRSLLRGERLTIDGQYVCLRDVELEHLPDPVPTISLGVHREKSLALAGRWADGTILAEGSSPAYVTWAREQIEKGRGASPTPIAKHRVTIYALCDVDAADPASARAGIRNALASFLADGSSSPAVRVLPYAAAIDTLIAEGGVAALEAGMMDAWIDDLAIAGSPDQCSVAIERLHAAGADSVVLVPPAELDPDAWLDRVGSQLLPAFRTGR